MLPRCTDNVPPGATREAKRCSSNCRNSTIHLHIPYGWSEISGGLWQNTAAFDSEEESILIWRCDVLQSSGWSQTPEDVRILALNTVQKRDPDAKVSKNWVRHSPYKRHPEIKLQWSQQPDRIHALCGSKGNYQAIKLFFDNILATPPASAPPPTRRPYIPSESE